MFFFLKILIKYYLCYILPFEKKIGLGQYIVMYVYIRVPAVYWFQAILWCYHHTVSMYTVTQSSIEKETNKKPTNQRWSWAGYWGIEALCCSNRTIQWQGDTGEWICTDFRCSSHELYEQNNCVISDGVMAFLSQNLTHCYISSVSR